MFRRKQRGERGIWCAPHPITRSTPDFLKVAAVAVCSGVFHFEISTCYRTGKAGATLGATSKRLNCDFSVFLGN